MCRLFAQHASPEHDLEEPLCSAPNALRMQSHRHPHGWGIGWYQGGSVHIRRGVAPAHADDLFVEAARAARSTVVLAHVRDASVGRVAEENTHPFAHRRWLFAHNGTVARFRKVARVRQLVEAEIDPALRALVRGETDSERCFFLFLTRLAARADLAGHPSLEDVRRAMAETVDALVRIADSRDEKPSSLNLLVTNGELIAACCRGRPLHLAPHATPSCLFAVASEPIGAGPWRPVEEEGFVGIDGELGIAAASLATGRLRQVA